jgi:hypothetical protein
MSCGTCEKAIVPGGLEATRAGQCHVCIWAEHDGADPWGLGAVACTISGRPVPEHVMGRPCPKGKHPDPTGVTTWLGVRWYGVPYPIRLWLWATHPNHRKPSWFGGCGCVVRLKQLWSRTARIIGWHKEFDHGRQEPVVFVGR